MIHRKMLLTSFVVLAVVILLGVLFVYKKQNGALAPSKYPTNGTSTSTPSRSGEYIELAFPDNMLDTSDWQMYRNEEFGFEVRYPKNWDVTTRTKKQLLEKNPSATYGSSYQGHVVLDPHSDPYSFVTFDVYIESVDQLIKEREWASFADPGPPPGRIGQINGAKTLYHITPDTRELYRSPFLVFIGNSSISYEVHNTLSGFPWVFEKILLSFRLIK